MVSGQQRYIMHLENRIWALEMELGESLPGSTAVEKAGSGDTGLSPIVHCDHHEGTANTTGCVK